MEGETHRQTPVGASCIVQAAHILTCQRPLDTVPGQPLLYQVFLGCPDKKSVDLHIVICDVHHNSFGRQVSNQFVFQPTNSHLMVHFPMVIATRAMNPEHNFNVRYESLILTSFYPAWSMIMLSPKSLKVKHI